MSLMFPQFISLLQKNFLLYMRIYKKIRFSYTNYMRTAWCPVDEAINRLALQDITGCLREELTYQKQKPLQVYGLTCF
jgi:hypothetical protein